MLGNGINNKLIPGSTPGLSTTIEQQSNYTL